MIARIMVMLMMMIMITVLVKYGTNEIELLSDIGIVTQN